MNKKCCCEWLLFAIVRLLIEFLKFHNFDRRKLTVFRFNIRLSNYYIQHAFRTKKRCIIIEKIVRLAIEFQCIAVFGLLDIYWCSISVYTALVLCVPSIKFHDSMKFHFNPLLIVFQYTNNKSGAHFFLGI